MANSGRIFGRLEIREDAIPESISGFEKDESKRFYASVENRANLNKYLVGTTTHFKVYKNKTKTDSVDIELNDTRPDDFGVFMKFVKENSSTGLNSRKLRKSRKNRKNRKQKSRKLRK